MFFFFCPVLLLSDIFQANFALHAIDKADIVALIVNNIWGIFWRDVCAADESP